MTVDIGEVRGNQDTESNLCSLWSRATQLVKVISTFRRFIPEPVKAPSAAARLRSMAALERRYLYVYTAPWSGSTGSFRVELRVVENPKLFRYTGLRSSAEKEL
jgi:hypothetical protein